MTMAFAFDIGLVALLTNWQSQPGASPRARLSRPSSHSWFTAIVWVELSAVDVALTEAAIASV